MRTSGVSATGLDQCQGMLVSKLLPEHLPMPTLQRVRCAKLNCGFQTLVNVTVPQRECYNIVVWARAMLLIQ